MSHEIWINSFIYPNSYSVSNFGRIKSKERLVKNSRNDGLKKWPSRIIKGDVRGGYLNVQLSEGGVVKRTSIHRLVAFSFNSHMDKSLVVNHLDFNRSNNYLDNLVICTQRENCAHTVRKGRHRVNVGEAAAGSKIKAKAVGEILRYRRLGLTYKEIAKLTDSTIHIVGHICRGDRWVAEIGKVKLLGLI